MKGLYPEEEVWLMSEAEKREINSEMVLRSKTGERLFTKPIEYVISALNKEELALFYEVLGILDDEYKMETSGMERLFLALEYIRYLRWLSFAFTTDEGSLRMNHVAYEKVVSDKMWKFFERLDQIRQERTKEKPKLVDFLIETLPEDKVEVKKVKYGGQPKAIEAQPAEGNGGSNQ